jgi:opacity protein-like surface antigen
MASISLAAATGHIRNGQDFWGASILVSADLSDTVAAEIGYGMKNYKSNANSNWASNSDVQSVLAGIYYNPVDQLTIGLEGEWIDPKGSGNDTTSVDLVTVYRF